MIHAAPYAQAIYRQLAVMFGAPLYAADAVMTFAVDLVPVAKERPRLGARGRTFTPERTRNAEQHLAWAFKLARRDGAPLVGNLAMVAVFFRPDKRRIDGDNMLKLVCDAGNMSGVWGDDSQVTTKLARIELDKAHPRTEIAIGPLASSLTR
jgi:Holliday junction resolvase RusA-like endonuclease